MIALDVSFNKELKDFLSLLKEIKNTCIIIEKESPSRINQIEAIQRLELTYFPQIDAYFSSLWRVISPLSAADRKQAQAEINLTILPYFHTPPLNQRIIDKPLGYDGDYITIMHYYKNDYEGPSVFDKFIHRYTLHIPVAQAVIYRFDYFYNKIIEITKRFKHDTPIKITSLGSGPASELMKFLNETQNPERYIINCIDSEPKAIEKVRSDVNLIKVRRGLDVIVNLFNINILKIIKMSKKEGALKAQHLIYAGGLFDYLNDKVAKSLINAAFAMLRSKGELIITNFLTTIPTRAYLENIGGWFLILRSKEDMLRLCSDLNKQAVITVDIDTQTHTNLYLRIVKK